MKISPLKIENFQIKFWYFSYFCSKHIDCGYSLEPPHWGSSNKYQQSMFLSRNKKNNVYPCKTSVLAKLYRYVFGCMCIHSVLACIVTKFLWSDLGGNCIVYSIVYNPIITAHDLFKKKKKKWDLYFFLWFSVCIWIKCVKILLNVINELIWQLFWSCLPYWIMWSSQTPLLFKSRFGRAFQTIFPTTWFKILYFRKF